MFDSATKTRESSKKIGIEHDSRIINFEKFGAKWKSGEIEMSLMVKVIFNNMQGNVDHIITIKR